MPSLDDTLKQYYYQDYLGLLNYQGDVYWAIDPGLEAILSAINTSPNYQSIYSKKFQAAGLAEDNISYLRLAYADEIKKELTGKLIALVNHLDGFNSEVLIREEHDLQNQIFDPNSDLACKNNSDYFRVNHYYIALKSDNPDKHEAFWNFLLKELGA